MNARVSLTFALSLKRDMYPEKTGGYIKRQDAQHRNPYIRP